MDSKVIEEVQTRYILHWNYRGLTRLPKETDLAPASVALNLAVS